jgi:acyl-CoA thioesterase I
MRSALLLVMLSMTAAGCLSRHQPAATNDSGRMIDSQQRRHVIVGPVTYVALGDSTAVGIGGTRGGYVSVLFRKLQEMRPGSKLHNYSASGSTTVDVSRQIEKTVAAKPQLVTISVGVNDIGRGVSAERFAANYDEILVRLTSETNAIVVISNIPDLSSSRHVPPPLRSQMQATIQQFNARLGEVANKRAVLLFDIYQLTHEELVRHPEYFSRDGFHPSDAGYDLWAEKMWPVVAAALGLTS